MQAGIDSGGGAGLQLGQSRWNSDHGKGARVLNPFTMRALIGRYGAVPRNDGMQVGHGDFLPGIGFDYRVDNKTVVRLGSGYLASRVNCGEIQLLAPAGGSAAS